MFKKLTPKKIALLSAGLFVFSATTVLTLADEEVVDETELMSEVDDGLHRTPTITADQQVHLLDEEKTAHDGMEIIKRDTLSFPESYPKELKNFETVAERYLLIDQETERVLAAKDAIDPYPIASISKIMPAYLTYKAVEEGKIAMEDVIEVSQEIEDYYSFNPESSSVGLYAGVNYPVKDLLEATMILSANDATAALMWEIYGSEEAAVQAIRNQLYDWGMTDFEFYTTSGFPNRYIPESLWVSGSGEDDQNMMSAADVALMTKKVVEEYPQLLEMTAQNSVVFMEDTDYEEVIANSNALLPDNSLGRDGVTGLKSGFTDAAGKCFVTTTTENDRKEIAVVLKVPDQEDMSSYEETYNLLETAGEFADLYKNKDLPIISLPTLAERQAVEEASRKESMIESDEQATDTTAPRNSPITEFVRRIKSFFN